MRILLVTPTHPLSPFSGAHQRTNLIYRALCKFADVDVLLVRPAIDPNDNSIKMDNLIGDLIWDSEYHRQSVNPYREDPKLSKWINANIDSSKYDVIVGRTLISVCKVGGAKLGKVILDYDDPDHLYSYADINKIAITPISKIVRTIKKKLKKLVISNILSKYSYVWFISDKDKALTPFIEGTILPNIPYNGVKTCSANVNESKIIMVVGLMTYLPNSEGVNRFLSSVWPNILSSEPSARLKIVGRGHAVDYERWSSVEGVEVVGFADTLDELYSECQFTIAPIYFGGGSNIKVLESFANCRTCVVTPFSHYGFEEDFVHGHSLYCAENDIEMSNRCIELLHDADSCHIMGEHGRDVVIQKYSIGNFQSIVETTVKNILGNC